MQYRELNRRPSRAASQRLEAGFTLAELLLAASLGAGVLMAAATVARQFGDRYAEASLEDTADVDGVLAGLARDISFSWWAELESPQRLVLADSAGALTTWTLHDGALLVERPDGSRGVILDGIAELDFSAEPMTRRRE